MRKITFVLAVAAALPGVVFATVKKHIVKNGQTLSAIAEKYGVSQKEILKANHLASPHKLKLGLQLIIPKAAAASKATVSKLTAKKGSKPGAKTQSVASAYEVREGDNDWILARRLGTTPSALRAINPGVKWTNLQIGQKLRVPGGSGHIASNSSGVIKTRHAVIAKDEVIIRRTPSTKAEKVTMVDEGTAVTVLDRDNGWYKLRFPKGTVGWVRGDMLTPLSSRKVARIDTSRSHSAYARREPAPGHKAVVTYDAPTTSSSLMDTALSFRGTRYHYGSASRSSTDCSGFALQVYRAAGVKLPRTSREQATVGTSVSKDGLHEGDLVFFKTNRGTRINHVGIYMGDGKFIHASSGKGSVRIDSLKEGYYDRRYATARRIKGNLPGNSSEIRKLQEAAKKAKAKPESEPAFEPDPPAPTKGVDEIIR